MKIPNLPGMRFDDPNKDKFHKKQNFMLSSNTMVEKYNPHAINQQEQKLIETLKSQLGTSNITQLMATMSVNRVHDKENYDDEHKEEQAITPNVLSFKGYFEEEAVESPVEKTVMRKLVVKYFLDDHTIEIIEPRVKNSGLPQGKFLRRQKVPKNGNYKEFLSFNDFEVGSSVAVFGRNIMIYAVDNFTREFYLANDIEQPESFEAPKDDYTKTLDKKTVRIEDPLLQEYKEYSEVRLGGGNYNEGLEKYLKNDGKMLIFDVVWNDETYAGGLNFYKLAYHLSDDKLEIKEINEPNNGKTPFPLFLKRSHLPKMPKLSHVPGMIPRTTQYYEAKDLVLGATIHIYNREFLLTNCDEFTRDYFKQNFDIDQIKLEGYARTKRTAKKVDVKVPPYNGFGSEEDSLGNCYSLIPKPPRIDMVKMFMYDKIILRFVCRIINDEFDLLDRKLILSFYCADDSLMIYLVTGKNSGVISGKFLEKKKYKNDVTGSYFKPQDFFVGQIVSVNKHVLQIVQADEFSLNYMEAKSGIFGKHLRSLVVVDLKHQMKGFKSTAELKGRFVRSNKYDKNANIKVDKLFEDMKDINAIKSYEELYFMLNMVSMVNSNWVKVDDFLNAIGNAFYAELNN